MLLRFEQITDNFYIYYLDIVTGFSLILPKTPNLDNKGKNKIQTWSEYGKGKIFRLPLK